MKKFNKTSKKGFTLVEMMLAIAIIMLISGLFVALIVAVKDSFYRVYNDNDSTDYAALYAQALENQMIYDFQNNRANTYYIDGTDYVLDMSNAPDGVNSADPFGFRAMNDFNHNKDGEIKWRVYLVAHTGTNTDYVSGSNYANSVVSSEHVIQYEFYMVDNYYNPGELVQIYSGSFWLPYHGDFQGVANTTPSIVIDSDGSTVSFDSTGGTHYTITPNKISVVPGGTTTP